MPSSLCTGIALAGAVVPVTWDLFGKVSFKIVTPCGRCVRDSPGSVEIGQLLACFGKSRHNQCFGNKQVWPSREITYTTSRKGKSSKVPAGRRYVIVSPKGQSSWIDHGYGLSIPTNVRLSWVVIMIVVDSFGCLRFHLLPYSCHLILEIWWALVANLSTIGINIVNHTRPIRRCHFSPRPNISASQKNWNLRGIGIRIASCWLKSMQLQMDS